MGPFRSRSTKFNKSKVCSTIIVPPLITITKKEPLIRQLDHFHITKSSILPWEVKLQDSYNYVNRFRIVLIHQLILKVILTPFSCISPPNCREVTLHQYFTNFLCKSKIHHYQLKITTRNPDPHLHISVTSPVLNYIIKYYIIRYDSGVNTTTLPPSKKATRYIFYSNTKETTISEFPKSFQQNTETLTYSHGS